MTTTDLIESFIDAGLKAFKSERKRSSGARKLDRHIPIELDRCTVDCRREFVCYKMSEQIKDYVPTAKVECVLCGNDSTINVELSEEEEQILNSKLYAFLKKWDCL